MGGGKYVIFSNSRWEGLQHCLVYYQKLKQRAAPISTLLQNLNNVLGH